MRLIKEDGEQAGIISAKEALTMAKEEGLDLVEVAHDANPPVCRMMNYGKYKYEQKRRIKEAKKRQHVIQVKELKMHPTIESHDYEFKKRHAREFIGAGNKVKLNVVFRGRSITHPEIGKRVLERLSNDLSDIASIEIGPKMEGRSAIMILGPKS